MPVRPSETRELFDRECRFPTERAAVIDRVGEATIASPGGEPVTVETVLTRSDQTQFASAADLHDTLMANLGGDHVGRRNYDDRSPNPGRDADVSF
jgi:hypothetical protein